MGLGMTLVMPGVLHGGKVAWGYCMGVSMEVEVIWHAGIWHQLGAAAHLADCVHAADPLGTP